MGTQTYSLTLSLPDAGQTLHVALPSSQEIAFTFTPDDALFDREGDNLVIMPAQPNGGSIIVDGFFARSNSDHIPDFILPTGERISGKAYAQALNSEDFVTETGHAAPDIVSLLSHEDDCPTTLFSGEHTLRATAAQPLCSPYTGDASVESSGVDDLQLQILLQHSIG